MNHHSTRSKKLELLGLLHQTALPPLSSKFTDLNNFDTIRIQFAKMMKSEVQGLSFKWGGEIPEKVKEWLDSAWYEAFKLLRGQNYDKGLGPIVKEIGFSKISDFFKSMIQKCYSLRLGGEHKMNTFHTNLSVNILRELLADKPDEIVEEQRRRLAVEEHRRKLAEEEQMRRLVEETGGAEEKRAEEKRAEEKRAEEQRAKVNRAEELRAEEQRAAEEHRLEEQKREDRIRGIRSNEERSQSRGRSRSNNRSMNRSINESRNRSSSNTRSRSNSRSREARNQEDLLKLLTPGILKTMHSDGIAHGENPSKYLQLLDKEVKEGLVVSMTMGIGQFISTNIFPADMGMAKDWMDWPLYCMVELIRVSIRRDKLFINHANATLDKVTEQPFASPGVSQLQLLTPQALQFWGIKFPNEIPVNLSHKPVAADLNATLLTLDPALSEVSTRVSRAPPVTSVLTQQNPPARHFSTSSRRSNFSPASHRSDPSPATSPIKHAGRNLSTASSNSSQLSISDMFTATKRAVSSSRERSISSVTSKNPATSWTPAASQTSAASKISEPSQTPSTSQIPPASQTPMLTVVDRMGEKRYRCPVCPGHNTFREEIVFESHMYNHHDGLS